jgi:hypothetical protein
MSDDLSKALKGRALARALAADEDPLTLLARQMGVTVEELAAELLKELVCLMKAIEPRPNEASAEQRKKLNEAFPGLPFDEQMKRLVEIDTLNHSGDEII